MRRFLFGLSLLLCACELDPIVFPTINDYDLFGPCDSDADCDSPEKCIYSEYDDTTFCLVPCIVDEQCAENERCGELVGEETIRACVSLYTPENST